MNHDDDNNGTNASNTDGFRPQQGLPIMNYAYLMNTKENEISFRPQQGLPIMNGIK